MQVHHLDFGSMRTIAALDDDLPSRSVVCHCLLIETPTSGLVLVDTGFGLDDTRNPRQRLGADFVDVASPVLDPEQSAMRQVSRLGFAPDDVRHIVLTHLHRDHTGGLPDFPDATVHLHEAEHRAVTDPTAEHHAVSLARLMPAHHAHQVRWAPARVDPYATWFGVRGIAPIDELPPDLVLVPLPGHTPGHSAVAVHDGERWQLHAGDSYLYHGELDEPPRTHPDVEPIQQGAQVDASTRQIGVRWLQGLRRDHLDEVNVFCAHDPWEFHTDGGPYGTW